MFPIFIILVQSITIFSHFVDSHSWALRPVFPYFTHVNPPYGGTLACLLSGVRLKSLFALSKYYVRLLFRDVVGALVFFMINFMILYHVASIPTFILTVFVMPVIVFFSVRFFNFEHSSISIWFSVVMTWRKPLPHSVTSVTGFFQWTIVYISTLSQYFLLFLCIIPRLVVIFVIFCRSFRILLRNCKIFSSHPHDPLLRVALAYPTLPTALLRHLRVYYTVYRRKICAEASIT